jgi:hypothetical protein
VANRFKQVVDLKVGGTDLYSMEPWHAALMGQITGTPSYCTWAVDRTNAFVTSEEDKIAAISAAPAGGALPPSPDAAYDSYLEVGPLIGNMALVYDWCRASMTDAQRTRWKNYGNQAVWNVWNHTQATWGNKTIPWTGWSVNNPVNNYYYSFLEATMLLGLATHGENTMADQWLTQFRTTKLENQLFPTFNQDLAGGGSREGTGYGVAMKNLWRLYDWWERSTGQRVADRTPQTLASIPWMMHAIVPTLDRLAPTGDHARDSSAALFDYHRDYLQVLATLFPGERLSGVAKTLLAQSSVPQMTQHFMKYSDYLYDLTPITARPLSDLSTAYWASGTGQFPMRSDWSTTAAYANFICGPYTESHAHRDQGSFTLFKGTWLAYDANIDGHSGIEQAEAMHNLVRFENSGTPVIQNSSPCNMSALANTTSYTYAVAKVTPVYRTPSPVVKSEREFFFVKPSTFIVYDRVQTTGSGMRPIWTLNLPATPTIGANTISLLRGGNRLDVTRLAPAGATTQPTQWSNVSSEFSGTTATRVDVRPTAVSDSSEFLHVLAADGSISQAVRSDATAQTGAMVTLADGRVVTVRFNTAAPGGTFEIRSGSGGAVLEGGALPATVQAPPLFMN